MGFYFVDKRSRPHQERTGIVHLFVQMDNNNWWNYLENSSEWCEKYKSLDGCDMGRTGSKTTHNSLPTILLLFWNWHWEPSTALDLKVVNEL